MTSRKADARQTAHARQTPGAGTASEPDPGCDRRAPATRDPQRRPKAVLTLGKFDGVHAGHRHLLAHAIEEAHRRGVRSAALVLHPDPRSVLGGEPVGLLSTLRDRCARIRAFGVDYAEPLHFTPEIAALAPGQFIDRVSRRFDLDALVVGPDFAFGKERAGRIGVLESLGRERGFDVRVARPLELGRRQVGSRHVRSMIEAGDIDRARTVLRSPPRLRGTVVHGSARGRTLGFPTANLDPAGDFVVPANGIYTVRAGWTRGPSGARTGRADGVASIGVRPTFGSGSRVIEIYLLDFEGELYGRLMTVDFLARQRPELKFDSPEELVRQMQLDVAEARDILSAEDAAPWYAEERGDLVKLRVRGRDLAALCENAAGGIFHCLGLQRPGPEGRVTRVEMSSDSDEELLAAWLKRANAPLGEGGAEHAEASVYQAGEGALHALLRGGVAAGSRPPLAAIEPVGPISCGRDGWLEVAVQIALQPGDELLEPGPR